MVDEIRPLHRIIMDDNVAYTVNVSYLILLDRQTTDSLGDLYPQYHGGALKCESYFCVGAYSSLQSNYIVMPYIDNNGNWVLRVLNRTNNAPVANTQITMVRAIFVWYDPTY